MIKRNLGLVIILLITLASCKKETRDLNEIQDIEIQEYLSKNNLSSAFTKDSSGFYYQIITPGTGEALTYPSDTRVYYLQDLKTLGGDIISPNSTLNITSSEKLIPLTGFFALIKPLGFRESIKKIRKGGKIRVLIPSNMAFGKTGIGTQVGGNAIIDATFDVLNAKTQIEADNILITRFRNTQTENYTLDPSGVYYYIINPGTGTETISLTSTISAAYTGKFLDGTVFDSATAENPLKLALGSLIQGWQATIPKIKKGGKIKLLIPAHQAYGSSTQSGLPPNASLQFDIEILDVTN